MFIIILQPKVGKQQNLLKAKSVNHPVTPTKPERNAQYIPAFTTNLQLTSTDWRLFRTLLNLLHTKLPQKQPLQVLTTESHSPPSAPTAHLTATIYGPVRVCTQTAAHG